MCSQFDKDVTFHVRPVNEYPPDVGVLPEIQISEVVLTRNFDDIYIVKCMSDVITNQTNPCRKHTPYQILYCVCFLHRPGLPERTLGAEYFGLHSHTGIHKFC